MVAFNEKNFTYLIEAVLRHCGAFVFLMDWNSFCSVKVWSFKNVGEIISGLG